VLEHKGKISAWIFLRDEKKKGGSNHGKADSKIVKLGIDIVPKAF
jgi:hypothetical protein